MKSFLKLSVFAIAITGIATSPVLAKRKKKQNRNYQAPAMNAYNSVNNSDIADIAQSLDETRKMLSANNVNDAQLNACANSVTQSLRAFQRNSSRANGKALLGKCITYYNRLIQLVKIGALGHYNHPLKPMLVMQFTTVRDHLRDVSNLI